MPVPEIDRYTSPAMALTSVTWLLPVVIPQVSGPLGDDIPVTGAPPVTAAPTVMASVAPQSDATNWRWTITPAAPPAPPDRLVPDGPDAPAPALPALGMTAAKTGFAPPGRVQVPLAAKNWMFGAAGVPPGVPPTHVAPAPVPPTVHSQKFPA